MRLSAAISECLSSPTHWADYLTEFFQILRGSNRSPRSWAQLQTPRTTPGLCGHMPPALPTTSKQESISRQVMHNRADSHTSSFPRASLSTKHFQSQFLIFSLGFHKSKMCNEAAFCRRKPSFKCLLGFGPGHSTHLGPKHGLWTHCPVLILL